MNKRGGEKAPPIEMQHERLLPLSAEALHLDTFISDAIDMLS